MLIVPFSINLDTHSIIAIGLKDAPSDLAFINPPWCGQDISIHKEELNGAKNYLGQKPKPKKNDPVV